MKTILITGTTGYLGSLLSKKFLENNYNLTALALNRNESFKYTDYKNCKLYYLSEKDISDIFKENKIDAVIHTAAIYGRHGENVIDILKANEEFSLQVLSEANKNDVEMFINIGTILTKNLNPYSLTKSHFADWLELYAGKMKCVNLKIDHFYGPNDNPVKFVAWIFDQLRKNIPSIDLTEGSQTREFLYVDDVISAVEIIINNADKLDSDKVNILEAGTGVKTSIKELVTTIKEELHNTTTKLNFGAIPFRKNEVLNYNINSSKLRLLGWNPKYTSVKDGIKRIIEIEKGAE